MNQQRLATVRRVRELQERLARQRVAVEQRWLAAADEVERSLRAAVADHGAHTGRATGGEIDDRARMLASGLAHADRAGDDVAAARRRVDDEITDWQATVQRHEGIERLAERLDAAERAESERRAAVEIDELVSATWRTSVEAAGAGA